VLGTTISKSNLIALQTLPCDPTISEFEYFLSQSMACQGKPILFSWVSEVNRSHFMVRVTHYRGERTLWQLLRYQNKNTATILEHTTNDVLLIHNLIMSACGNQHKEIVAEGAFTVNGPQRDVSKVAYVSNRGMALVSDLDGQVVKNDTGEMERTSVDEQMKRMELGSFGLDSTTLTDQLGETKRVMATLFSQTPLGILSYAAFLFLLEKEFYRAYRAQSSIAILVLQVFIYAENPARKHQPLPMQGYVQIIDRINKMKREVDALAQLDNDRLILLLPETTKEGAKEFANRLENAVMQLPLCAGIDPVNINVSTGVAAAPRDSQDINSLIVKACAAQCKAKVATARVGEYAKPSIAKLLRPTTCPAAI
jgi:hypothetical protein